MIVLDPAAPSRAGVGVGMNTEGCDVAIALVVGVCEPFGTEVDGTTATATDEAPDDDSIRGDNEPRLLAGGTEGGDGDEASDHWCWCCRCCICVVSRDEGKALVRVDRFETDESGGGGGGGGGGGSDRGGKSGKSLVVVELGRLKEPPSSLARTLPPTSEERGNCPCPAECICNSTNADR